LVNISGGGFKPFTSITSVEFAGLGTLGGRTVSTDAQGNLMIPEVLVPGLEVGIVDLVVNVSGVTAITVFEVTDSGVGGVAPRVPVAAGLAPLGGDWEGVSTSTTLPRLGVFSIPGRSFPIATLWNN